MGLVYADIELLNGGDVSEFRKGSISKDNIRQMHVKAMLDSGAYMLAINENIKNQLGLHVIEESTATLANGTEIILEIVGPIELRFLNRRASVDAMVLPGDNEVLLGAIPMEQMDVLIDPKKQTLIVNPKHPFKPGFVLK